MSLVKSFNLILVPNRSRGCVLKHRDLWTVQMALNFCLSSTAFSSPEKKETWKELKSKMLERKTLPRLLIIFWFHNSFLRRRRPSAFIGLERRLFDLQAHNNGECSIFNRFLILRIFFRWFCEVFCFKLTLRFLISSHSPRRVWTGSVNKGCHAV